MIFFIAADNQSTCSQYLYLFIDMCEDIGVPLAPDKTTQPSQIITFAGIELDAKLQEARLPQDKLDKCFQLIAKHYRCKKITLKDLQSVIGLLNFCCYIVPMGRAFLRRLINLTRGVSKPNFHIRLNKDARADLLTWHTFLTSFNGKGFFHDCGWPCDADYTIHTDSSGALGYGALYGNLWFSGKWPPELQHINIAVLELYPIVVSFLVWQGHLANKKITVYSDNEALVFILNKCTSKDNLIMQLIRTLILTCLQHNIQFRALHIPGANNTAADALSRFHFQKFRNAAPGAHSHPTPIPDQWSPTNLIPA